MRDRAVGLVDSWGAPSASRADLLRWPRGHGPATFDPAIDPARLPELQEEMESFLARFFGRCEGEETPREADPLSLACFPLSDRREGWAAPPAGPSVGDIR